MKLLNVIDLDKTLLPYDSFRKYIFLFLKNKHFTLQILFLIIVRRMRFIDSTVFKKKIVEIARRDKYYNDKMEKFSDALYVEIDDSVAEIIRINTNKDTINVLCTASPEDYVKRIAEKKKWMYLCSSFNDGIFLHMFGKQKVISIKSHFPCNKYEYNFAISDNKNDLELLRLFKVYKLLNNN